MKMKKLILALTLLTVASPVLAMERESNYANNNNKPSELINLPDEIWGNVIAQYHLNQDEIWGNGVHESVHREFLENLALTSRKFAALLKKDVVRNAIINALATKISDPQELLFNHADFCSLVSQFGSPIMLAALKKAGAEINCGKDSGDEKGITPLIKAVKGEKIKFIQYLIEAGADINRPATNYEGRTPLMYANKNHQIVKLLLELGADPTLEDNTGSTALGYATAYPVKQLLEDARTRILIKGIVKEAILELLSSSELKEILREMKNKENNNNS